MAVVLRTLVCWAISHVYTGHPRSLGGIYPLIRIETLQEIDRLKVLNSVCPEMIYFVQD
jgi:hypothetical protein